MNVKYSYWYFPAALSLTWCDDVINFAKQQEFKKGITKEYSDKKLSKKNMKNLKKLRDSDISWLDQNWIYKEIHPYMIEANYSAGWNHDTDWNEVCQFTTYDKNQHYDWHCDANNVPYDESINNPNLVGKIRKLSMTCTLSDPSEYEGGLLEFSMDGHPERNEIRECKEILPKGSVVVFPSFVWHRVKPVTKGKRYSLVMWSAGKPYV